MKVFEWAIRTGGESPPLKQAFVLFGRVSSTLCFNTFIVFLFHLYIFQKWSFRASFGLYTIMIHVVTLLDGLVSNAFGRNIQNLCKAGFSDWTILVYMEVNFFSSQMIGLLLQRAL